MSMLSNAWYNAAQKGLKLLPLVGLAGCAFYSPPPQIIYDASQGTGRGAYCYSGNTVIYSPSGLCSRPAPSVSPSVIFRERRPIFLYHFDGLTEPGDRIPFEFENENQPSPIPMSLYNLSLSPKLV